jgi:hypothetical protein
MINKTRAVRGELGCVLPLSKRAGELAEGCAQAIGEFKSRVQQISDEAWARPVSSGDPRGVGVVVWA